MKLISLFSDAGRFDKGFHKGGLHIIVANEVNLAYHVARSIIDTLRRHGIDMNG